VVKQANPDEARVAFIYEKLTGRQMLRGQWDVEKRNFAQRIVHVENACRSVLDAIDKLTKADSEEREEIETAVSELKTELRFLNTLNEHTTS